MENEVRSPDGVVYECDCGNNDDFTEVGEQVCSLHQSLSDGGEVCDYDVYDWGQRLYTWTVTCCRCGAMLEIDYGSELMS